MSLREEIERVGELAQRFAAPGETLAGILAAEPRPDTRVYLCAFVDEAGTRSWIALDAEGEPIRSRTAVRDAVSIAALCELAEETAGGGDLERLRADLVTLRLTENPPGIDEAEAAALELERVLGALALRGHCAGGRLALEELWKRLDGAYRARTAGGREQALRELPAEA